MCLKLPAEMLIYLKAKLPFKVVMFWEWEKVSIVQRPSKVLTLVKLSWKLANEQ